MEAEDKKEEKKSTWWPDVNTDEGLKDAILWCRCSSLVCNF